MNPKKQQGFGLIELMVALVIGMIVVGGVLALFVNTLGSNSSQMKMSRLNNELRMAMTSITRDLRRAGYHNWTIPQLTTGIYLTGGAGKTSPQPVSTITSGTANDEVDVSYDENSNSLYTVTESYGFRYDSTDKTIEAKIGAGSWSSIIDTNAIEITAFTITNISPAAIAPVGATSSVTVPVYSISITGRLKNDTAVVRTLQETVRLRNVIVS
ncbi:MAG: prepilin-type N-terminal cleavage/methylation domain-containing protein [Burkholderiaceae bacterium]